MEVHNMYGDDLPLRTVIAIVPLAALLAPSYTRTLIAVLKKQPDAYASILIFLPVILLSSTVMLFILTMLGCFLATLAAQRVHLVLFSSCLPDAWLTHLLVGIGGTWAIARATRKEGNQVIPGWLDSTLCMLLSVSIMAAASLLSDMGAWFGVGLAAFALDLSDPESQMPSVEPGDRAWVYVVCGTVVPLIVVAVVLCTVVAKAAAKHKSKEQWLEVEDGTERYQDEERSEEVREPDESVLYGSKM